MQDRSSGIWKIRHKGADGRIHEISTGQTSKEKARRVINVAKIKELELAMRAGVVQRAAIESIVVGKQMLVADAIIEWVKWLNSIGKSPFTIANYQSAIRKWAADTGNERLPVYRVDEVLIDGWVNDPSPIKFGQRNIRLSAFKSFCLFSVARQWMTNDASALVEIKRHLLTHDQKETKVKRLFTEHMIETILAKTDRGSFWHAAVAIGAYTGLRLGDICSLQWACFDEDLTRMKVWTDKSDTPVLLRVDTPAVLRMAIAAIPAQDLIWCFPEQRAITIDPKRRALLSYSFTRMLERLGIEDRSFHCLRHTYATQHHKAGKDLYVIRTDLGHKSVETTRGYIHNSKLC